MKKSTLVGIIILIAVLILGYKYFSKSSITPIVSQNNAPGQSTSQNSADIPQASVFTSNLVIPWAIAFLPDNRLLVTERTGKVRIVDSKGNLAPEPAATIQVKTQFDGEDGLLGIALHPDFNKNHLVYLYYSFENAGKTLNRVVRMKFDNDKLGSEQIIVDNIPGAIYHDGGRIKFGPDGFLYITTGDARDSSNAQNKNSLAGKVLRVTDEGKPAPGNPFNNLIYSYGHRNPQGIAWSSTGALWETEHGRSNPTGFDEVNLIQPGKNYGWEIIQGDEAKAGLETPKRNSGPTTTWAPSGAAFLGNSFFFAGLKGETLFEAVIQGDNIVDFKEHLKGQFGRLRDVVVGPDGMLYITTSNRDGRGIAGDDKIIRVNPNKL